MACRLAVAGKLAARDLTAWVAGFDVSETEFRLLWLLSSAMHADCKAPAPAPAVDQAELASRLAVSAAQVSGVVERLRHAGLIEHGAGSGDRRRQFWQLAEAGRELVREIVAAVESLPTADHVGKEAA
jgi:DNA-binding MarR family transcriptional regulator